MNHTKQSATKQGVRDLNGPRMTGTGYNGNKSTTCAHHRAPDAVATHMIERMVVDKQGYPKTTLVTCCSSCGQELYENV